MLGIGMIIGAVIGAGVTLLVAPKSGADTRRSLSRTAGRFTMGAGVWNKLGKELRRAAQAKRKTLELQAKRQEVETRRAVRGESAPD
jgi:gas vesicle protein